jgi:hypothetical protein
MRMMLAVAVATRLCQSATTAQLVAWLLVASFAAPFAVWVVRAGKKDVRKALIAGFAILLVVGVLVGTANAFPMADPCETCRAIWPEWVCILRLCF